jgi:uncharacterized membrane protein
MLGRALAFLSVACVVCAGTYFGTQHFIVKQAPIKVMSTIQSQMAKTAGGWNRCYHNQNYGPRANTVRRANPDSIVSAMAYDLRDGPVRVSGEVWPRYWSLSLYQQNSDNFFVVNDRQINGTRFDYILAIKGQDVSQLDGEVIMSPTPKGILLIRRFAANIEDMPGIVANQQAMTCAPIQG